MSIMDMINRLQEIEVWERRCLASGFGEGGHPAVLRMRDKLAAEKSREWDNLTIALNRSGFNELPDYIRMPLTDLVFSR